MECLAFVYKQRASSSFSKKIAWSFHFYLIPERASTQSSSQGSAIIRSRLESSPHRKASNLQRFRRRIEFQLQSCVICVHQPTKHHSTYIIWPHIYLPIPRRCARQFSRSLVPVCLFCCVEKIKITEGVKFVALSMCSFFPWPLLFCLFFMIIIPATLILTDPQRRP